MGLASAKYWNQPINSNSFPDLSWYFDVQPDLSTTINLGATFTFPPPPIGSQYFSALFTFYVSTPNVYQNYTFFISVDDGVMLRVNGVYYGGIQYYGQNSAPISVYVTTPSIKIDLLYVQYGGAVGLSVKWDGGNSSLPNPVSLPWSLVTPFPPGLAPAVMRTIILDTSPFDHLNIYCRPLID